MTFSEAGEELADVQQSILAPSQQSWNDMASPGVPPHLRPLLGVGIGLAVPLFLWITLLGLGSIPWLQRHFLYAHKINTLFWHDINKPEHWGFAKNQVTPFTLRTADNEILYGWHIMPLPVYLRNEDRLLKEPSGLRNDYNQSEAFRILKEDPNARLVIFYGTLELKDPQNAGHIAQGNRPPSYHALTDTSSYHVLAIDYRGYGHSTGHPNEAGLIEDGTAVVRFALETAGIPSNRIVLLGQSLGTAVATAVAESFTVREKVEFAGVVLVAGFSDLPRMLSGYAIAGWIPLLTPLRPIPPALRLAQRMIVERWPSAERLANLVRATGNRRLRLHLVHAKNDWDIPCHEDDKLFAAAAGATAEAAGLDEDAFMEAKALRTVDKGKDAFVTTWRSEPNIIIRQELFGHGGHNDIMYYAPVSLAVMRAFELEGTVYG